MKFYAQALDLINDPSLIKEYEEHHKNVWPETLQALKNIGVIRMRIFRINNRLFMFMETSDTFTLSSFSDYSKENLKAKEWDNLMNKYQQQIPNPKGSWWSEMSLAFDSSLF